MIESEVHSELCQTSKMESFTEVVNGFKKTSIFKGNSILLRIYSNYTQRGLFIAEHLNQ